MTRYYTLTNGTISVELAAWTTTGVSAQRGGLGPNRVAFDLPIQTSRKVGHNSLGDFSAEPVIERWNLNIRHSSQVNAAEQVTIMMGLLRQAMKYHSPDYPAAITPVYIKREYTTGGKDHYALVTGCLELMYPDLFKTPFEVDNRLEGVMTNIVREPYWREVPPGFNLDPSDAVAMTNKERPVGGIIEWMPVGNADQGNDVTHVYVFDASGPSWSANQVANDSFDLLPAAPAAGDILYIGSEDGVFHTAILEIQDVLTGTGITYDWEWWTGAAWVSMTAGSRTWPAMQISDPSYGLGLDLAVFDNPTAQTSIRCCLNWYGQNAWATTTINGVNAYWIRFRLTAVTTVTLVPSHFSAVGFGVRSALSDYFDVDAQYFMGDSPSLVRFRMKSQFEATGTIGDAHWISRLTIAAKSRGLTFFKSKITLGVDTGDWDVIVGSSTSLGLLAKWAAFGRSALCDFATPTEAVRLYLKLEDSIRANSYRGKYQVKLVVSQIGGSAGDVDVKIGFNTVSRLDEPIWESEYVSPVTVGAANTGASEVLDFGIMSIPGGDAEALVEEITNLAFIITAQAASSTPDIHFQELWLIPVDEFSVILDDPVIPFNAAPPISRFDSWTKSGNMQGGKYLNYDLGIVLPWPRSWISTIFDNSKPATNESVLLNWITRGEPRGVEPGEDTRFYFFFEAMKPDGNPGEMIPPWTAPVYLNTMSFMWSVSRWQGIRGLT